MAASVGVIVAMTLFCIAKTVPAWSTADFWMYSVMSTRKLTFFYWEQNRLANLAPALAFPIQDPFINAYAVMMIGGIGFFGVFVAVAFIATVPNEPFAQSATQQDSRDWDAPLASVIGMSLCFVAFQAFATYRFAFEQPYGISLFLYLIGCTLVSADLRWYWRILALPLVIAALLVNPSSALFAGLTIPVALAFGRLRTVPLQIAVTVVGIGLTTLASARSPVQSTSEFYTKVELDDVLGRWRTAASNTWSAFASRPTIGIGIIASICVVWNWRHLHRATRTLLALMPLFALGWMLLFALIAWVRMNVFDFRYFFPTYLAFATLVIVGASSAIQLLRRNFAVPVGLFPILTGAAIVALVTWSATAWQPMEKFTAIAAVQAPIEYARVHDVRFIGGDYWTTWPTVLAIGEGGEEAFGFADRGAAMRPEMVAEVDEMEAQGEQIQIMCLGIDAPGCISQFEWTTEKPWSQTAVANEQPLVLTLSPRV